jgi:SAM-dependent methyltransferase
MTECAPQTSAEQFWENFYLDRDQVWSGEPNPLLVREVGSVTAGTALDVGCAEGADAVWLASLGWQVTAVDVSETALRRAAARAEAAGVGDRIDWQRHDLSSTFPEGTFDLVSAQFLHSPVALADERRTILRKAARATAPGGLLLIVGHAGGPTWHQEPPVPPRFPTTDEVLDSLDLEPGRWDVELADVITRESIGPEGHAGTCADNLLRIRHREGATAG